MVVGVTLPRSVQDRPPVPVRAMLTAIGLVLSTVAVLYVVVVTRRVLTWIMIAAFFAVALYPPPWVGCNGECAAADGGRWRRLWYSLSSCSPWLVSSQRSPSRWHRKLAASRDSCLI